MISQNISVEDGLCPVECFAPAKILNLTLGKNQSYITPAFCNSTHIPQATSHEHIPAKLNQPRAYFSLIPQVMSIFQPYSSAY